MDLKLAEVDWPRRAIYFLVGKTLESVLEFRVVLLQQAGTDLLADWPTFQNGMRNAFSPVSPDFAVRAKLDKLKQTNSMSAYWEAFRASVRVQAPTQWASWLQAVSYYQYSIRIV